MVADVRTGGVAVIAAPVLLTVMFCGLPFTSRLFVMFVFSVMKSCPITELPAFTPVHVSTILATFSASPVLATWTGVVLAVRQKDVVCAEAVRQSIPTRQAGTETGGRRERSGQG